MGVRAHHKRNPPVEIAAHRLFFTRRLAMEIDENRIDHLPERRLCHHAIDRGKRIIQRIHKQARHGIDHQNPRASGRIDNRRATTRRCGRIINRAKQSLLPLNKDQRLALIKSVVAQGHNIGARIEQIIADHFRDAETACGIFTVDHNAIKRPPPPEAREGVKYGVAAGSTDNIAKKEQAHEKNSSQITKPVLAWSGKSVMLKSVCAVTNPYSDALNRAASH